jgi:hypothetical protein
LFDKNFVHELKVRFATGVPYRHVVIDNLLSPKTAQALSRQFPCIGQMKTRYKGMNEKKAEHSEFHSLPQEFTQLKELLFCNDFIQLIEEISEIKNLLVMDDRFGYGLHQGGNGSFLDIHIDYNLHPVLKKQRRLNLLIFLNEEWKEGWGGLLQFWNADVTKCITAIAPLFNRCVLFECNENSYHGYNLVQCPAEITRKSFYTYYFTEPVANLRFHDTVFKSLPHDSAFKRFSVTTKEALKNGVKRLLYKTGLLKLLK